MNVKRIAVFVSGRGSNMDALVKASRLSGSFYSVSVVISDNSDAEALKKAEKEGIPAITVPYSEYKSRKDAELKVLEILKEYSIDFIVLAGFMRIIGKTLLKAYPQKILNIHPSLLPSFKGLHAQKQAIDYGVKFSGCTVHIVDEGTDTGPVLAQAVVPVTPEDTETSLSSEILKREHVIYPETVNKFASYEYRLSGRKIYPANYGNTPQKLVDRFKKLHFSADYKRVFDEINNSSTEPVAVSACLLGIPCRYDGLSKSNDKILKLFGHYEILPVCPEVLAGLSIPRVPMEFKNGDGEDMVNGKSELIDETGKDLSEAMLQGANKALSAVKNCHIKKAILKARSPSCGIKKVHSAGNLIDGKGVFAYFLMKSGVCCINEEDQINDINS